jgi:hypothetical protein
VILAFIIGAIICSTIIKPRVNALGWTGAKRITEKANQFITELGDVVGAAREYILILSPSPKVNVSLILELLNNREWNGDWRHACFAFRADERQRGNVWLTVIPYIRIIEGSWQRSLLPTYMAAHVFSGSYSTIPPTKDELHGINSVRGRIEYAHYGNWCGIYKCSLNSSLGFIRRAAYLIKEITNSNFTG